VSYLQTYLYHRFVNLAEIQRAIEELPKHEQAALAAWLAEREQAEWEAEIERDFSPGGPGIPLLEEMKAEERAGKFRPSGRRPASLAPRYRLPGR